MSEGCGSRRRGENEGRGCGCDSPRHEHRHFAYPGAEGAGFGVRRPLRFLAWRLELGEAQVSELARILNELKTERAQSEVDERRALTAFADAVAGETFAADQVGAATAERVKSAERVQAQVAKALEAIHALLEPEQRAKLAYLIRTGALVM
jgi:Spy/CpxP family protein refolding chaperone